MDSLQAGCVCKEAARPDAERIKKSVGGTAIPTNATENYSLTAYQKEGNQSMHILTEQQEAAMIAHAAELVIQLQQERHKAEMYRDWYNEARLALDALTAKKEDANEF